jgi:Protein of unknown function (DUF3617)
MKPVLPMLALVAALGLAACNKDVDMKNASLADVGKALEGRQRLDPGQWTTTVEILDVKMTGLSEKEQAMAATMTQAMKGQKRSQDTCLTPEQAKKPVSEMFAGPDQGNCRYDSFKLSGGNMDAIMACTPPSPQPGVAAGKMTLTLKGKYEGDKYDVHVQMNGAGMPGSPPGSTMTMIGRNSGTRTGNCPKA